MLHNLIELDVDIDRQQLLNEAEDLSGYKTFIDPKTNDPINGWLIKRIETGYGQIVSDFFKKQFNLKDCRPRFYIQEPGVDIPFHKDRGTLCSFNFVLSDKPDPIWFRNGSMVYRNALLNTAVDHAVLNTKSKRVLFKLSIFDQTFQEIKDVLPLKIQIR